MSGKNSMEITCIILFSSTQKTMFTATVFFKKSVFLKEFSQSHPRKEVKVTEFKIESRLTNSSKEL